MSTSVSPPDAEDRLRRVESVTDAALARLDVEDLLVELLDRLREVLEVDTAHVLLLDASSRQLVATVVRGLEDEVPAGVRFPMGSDFTGRVAAEKQPVIIEQVNQSNVSSPTLLATGVQSLVGVPMLAGGEVVGVLHVGTVEPRRFTEDDVSLLQLVADRAALATRSRLSGAERAAVAALQRSLLPPRLPDVPGLEMAARYVSGEAGGVGGDWYDLFVLPGGELCIVIGDVVGRGLPAAVVMGRLRSALRAYALEGSDPADVLARLNRKSQHFEPDMMATVLYAMFDPSLERVRISSAGHPAPVFAMPGERARLLDVPTDPPIGVAFGRRQTTTVQIPPGALVYFYTDGLIERRGSSLDVGLRRLEEAVRSARAETVCVETMARLVGAEPPRDDIAVLAVRRKDGTEIGPLDLDLPAVARSLLDVRIAMRRWLSTIGAGPDDVVDLLIAVGEACANAVEHAYDQGSGRMTVHMELQAPYVLAAVADAGRWREPTLPDRRGLLLMRECSDSLRIDRGAGGTTVHIRRRIAENGDH